MNDDLMINGLSINNQHRTYFENEFYLQYKYFIKEGCSKYKLSGEDSFSAYSDAVLSAIHNIGTGKFDKSASIKTYLFQIFRNKCVDLVRKITNNKEKVNQSTLAAELLSHLPDAAKNAVERLIDNEKMLAIKQGLETIGQRCKEILLLYEDGYNDKQIAERFDYNNAAVVKTTRLRCREKLKSLYNNHE
ncbi:MAG: sigma-70 family polymerase sigma factor [Segetibacter sp.]|jgi:RNA polymerase sigma-70 factor (ECF subfamily)|nr:sigma-70 family polymerase sigma factor [Segetibacter sp.]